MKAVILAAGEGHRMYPLTCTRPKVMLSVANKPILEHLLIEFIMAGIDEFVFVIGYHGDQVRDYFGDGERWGVEITYCQQPRQMGTANAVGMVKEMVSGNFLVMNGDIIIPSGDIEVLAASYRHTMSIVEVVNDRRELGMVEANNNRVTRIHEKSGRPSGSKANAGLYLFTPNIFTAISRTPKSLRGEYEITDSLQMLIDSGQEVCCEEIQNWYDLSYPWDLLSVNESLLTSSKPHNAGDVEPNVVMRGNVSIGRNTVVRSGSYIVGPVAIGEHCEIGPNCYIRPATAIGDRCHIGASVEVKNSIIMNDSKIPHHNYVGDSVIGEACNLGAGTKIANLRLDKKEISVAGKSTRRHKLGAIIGDNVQVGINVSINAGSVIGNNTTIGPGTSVSDFVLPDSRIR